MKKFKVKKDDKVVIISGKEKGKTGVISKVIKLKDRVIVAGLNLVKKHVKASKDSAGGIVNKEASIHISNVSLICPKTDKRTKVGYKILEDGKKVRFAKKSGELI